MTITGYDPFTYPGYDFDDLDEVEDSEVIETAPTSTPEEKKLPIAEICTYAIEQPLHVGPYDNRRLVQGKAMVEVAGFSRLDPSSNGVERERAGIIRDATRLATAIPLCNVSGERLTIVVLPYGDERLLTAYLKCDSCAKQRTSPFTKTVVTGCECCG